MALASMAGSQLAWTVHSSMGALDLLELARPKQQKHPEPIQRRQDHDEEIGYITLQVLYPDEEFENPQDEDKRLLPTATYHENDPSRVFLPEPLRTMTHLRPSGIASLRLAPRVLITSQEPERLSPSTSWSETELVLLFVPIDPSPGSSSVSEVSCAMFPTVWPLSEGLRDRARGTDGMILRFIGPIRRRDASGALSIYDALGVFVSFAAPVAECLGWRLRRSGQEVSPFATGRHFEASNVYRERFEALAMAPFSLRDHDHKEAHGGTSTPRKENEYPDPRGIHISDLEPRFPTVDRRVPRAPKPPPFPLLSCGLDDRSTKYRTKLTV
ncbi:uncharacterized protein NECHADRAFT_85648 [Fusarium vanettenii 77-13-4]|uniref:Uncharacterized protein n=1 Tax=Fusarium vanettenii (strain ATCC MYA-4622 / CBS 123669 / FGSC 9596 / NRRL 45880 / 77-13-4) TaxID=660122 RepID=C7ZPA2_FUSV7|nr:uncharacterized protein NECHADRAFT_85648 [Fusarium vanettenii 77-13-4]EEU34313.1 predicted protein [Fusarium vanettenii 77-13-4]